MELLNSIIDHVNNEQLQLAARSSSIGRSRKSSRRMVDIMDFQEKMHKNEVKNKSNPTIRLFRWKPPPLKASSIIRRKSKCVTQKLISPERSISRLCSKSNSSLRRVNMISAQRLREIFNDCLLGNTNPTTEAVILINGVNGTFGLDPEKVDIHMDEIKEMLDQLPSQFREASEGGSDGYSFMALPFDSTGAQWGEQINANELMVLGLATGYMQYLFSAEFWSALPGSVPYVLIHKDPIAVKRNPFNSYVAGERSIDPLIM